jgi:L-ascorbate metabolism protein UlaG (beta-lactamase superfamily)
VDQIDPAVGTVTFVGNATTLLRIGEFTLLTDPNFLHAGQRAYLGKGMFAKRLTEPALEIMDLPLLDLVLLSHLHGDHFDRVVRREMAKTVPIVTTRQACRQLTQWGFVAAIGLETWERREWRRSNQLLRITAVPAQHGPRPVDRLLPDVMGSIVDLWEDGLRRLRLYITGDTLYRPVLSTIPERFPTIDAMLIHLGGTRLLGVLMSMDARQGNNLMEVVRAGLTVPIHYDDYSVFRSPLGDFLEEARRRDMLSGIRPIGRGESISLPGLAVRQPGDPAESTGAGS